jgi:hypothetical protein
MLKDECGLLVITSCNWTGSELQDHFKDFFEQVRGLKMDTRRLHQLHSRFCVELSKFHPQVA